MSGARAGRRIRGVLAGLVLGTAAPLLGRAEEGRDLPRDLTEIPLEQLMTIATVEGAARHEQKVTDAPSSVSIVTADDIRRHGYLTLAEALAGVRGFYATYDRNYTYLGVRGFSRPSDYNSRVLVLIASYGTGAGRVAHARTLGRDGDLILSGSGYRSAGQDLFFSELDDPATNDGVARGVDADAYYRGFGRLRLGNVAVTGPLSWREKEIPTGSFGTTFGDERNRTFDQRSFLDVRYARRLGEGGSLTGRAYYDNFGSSRNPVMIGVGC
jgi:hypothetical protein